MINQDITLDQINSFNANTLTSHIGIEFTGFGEKYLEAKMPLDKRTHQPMGLLHGGASVVLAETIGSIAASFTVNQKLQHCVGLEINANHIRSVSSGYVFGRTKSIHLGKRTQIWEINITNEEDKLVCISRLTMAVIDKKN